MSHNENPTTLDHLGRFSFHLRINDESLMDPQRPPEVEDSQAAEESKESEWEYDFDDFIKESERIEGYMQDLRQILNAVRTTDDVSQQVRHAMRGCLGVIDDLLNDTESVIPWFEPHIVGLELASSDVAEAGPFIEASAHALGVRLARHLVNEVALAIGPFVRDPWMYVDVEERHYVSHLLHEYNEPEVWAAVLKVLREYPILERDLRRIESRIFRERCIFVERHDPFQVLIRDDGSTQQRAIHRKHREDDWHAPGETPPAGYHGPLEGKQKEITGWIQPGSTDSRCLRGRLQSGAIWGRRERRYNVSVWFRDEAKFDQAKAVRDRGESRPERHRTT